MFEIDLSKKVALITGGTKGIGLGTAKALASAGASCVMTYRGGTGDLEGIKEECARQGWSEPMLEMADVSKSEDTVALMERIKERHDGVDIFISNVAFAARTPELSDYKKRSLVKSLEYSAWPLVDYVETIKESFGRYPGHVVA